MSIPSAWPQVLDFFGTPLVIEPSPGQLYSDAGLLPVPQFDDRIVVAKAEANDRGTNRRFEVTNRPALTEIGVPSWLEVPGLQCCGEALE
jgi:hypothetical protein